MSRLNTIPSAKPIPPDTYWQDRRKKREEEEAANRRCTRLGMPLLKPCCGFTTAEQINAASVGELVRLNQRVHAELERRHGTWFG